MMVVAGVLCLVVLAGCSSYPLGDPPNQEEPAPVKLVNNATITETFEVAVVDVATNLTVTREDGDKFNSTVRPGSSTIITTSNNKFVNIKFPNSARVIGQYTLEPGENTTLSIDKVAPNQAIVVLVYDEPEEQYRAIKSLSCGGAITGYKIVTKAGGDDDWTPGVHGCKPGFPL
ncbi:hypothetical protein [Haloarchaeobius sp. TZWWS8]|uniref:hypothetical protein n=1 Tax=Haloarchaeobius sp. TZWWS8 TaxID=3446121 RepID=UPI003EC0AF01